MSPVSEVVSLIQFVDNKRSFVQRVDVVKQDKRPADGGSSRNQPAFLLEHPQMLDIEDIRARCSVVEWDIRRSMTLIGKKFPPAGVRGCVATFLFFIHLSVATPVGSEQGGRFLFAALGTVRDLDLSIFATPVAAALRTVDFSKAFLLSV